MDTNPTLQPGRVAWSRQPGVAGCAPQCVKTFEERRPLPTQNSAYCKKTPVRGFGFT